MDSATLLVDDTFLDMRNRAGKSTDIASRTSVHTRLINDVPRIFWRSGKNDIILVIYWSSTFEIEAQILFDLIY